jgi:hypothetical protein
MFFFFASERRCETCTKKISPTQCSVLNVMEGMDKDCFAWDGDPNWSIKVYQQTENYDMDYRSRKNTSAKNK